MHNWSGNHDNIDGIGNIANIIILDNTGNIDNIDKADNIDNDDNIDNADNIRSLVPLLFLNLEPIVKMKFLVFSLASACDRASVREIRDGRAPHT